MPYRSPHACPQCRKPTTRPGRCDACARAYEAARGTSSERGYGSEWRRKAKDFLATHSRCVHPGCERTATDVDHRIPWRTGRDEAERYALFWDQGNWQPLCHEHHSSKTATRDGGLGRSRTTQGAAPRGCGDVGQPPIGGEKFPTGTGGATERFSHAKNVRFPQGGGVAQATRVTPAHATGGRRG